MFVKECPKCGEKTDIEIYAKQEVNTKISCLKCGARWLVPNSALEKDVEWKKLEVNFYKKPKEVTASL